MLGQASKSSREGPREGTLDPPPPPHEVSPPSVKEDAWGPDQKVASKSSREAPREGTLDPPPPPHEVSMKSRGSNKELLQTHHKNF